jgi:hypothetical protein
MISQKSWNNPSYYGQIPGKAQPFGYSEKSPGLKVHDAIFNQNHRIGFRGNFQMFLQKDPGFGLECYKTIMALCVVPDDETDTPVTEVAKTVENNYRVFKPERRSS